MSKTRTMFSLIGVFTVIFSLLLFFRPDIYPGSPEIPGFVLDIVLAAVLILLGFYAIKSFSISFLKPEDLFIGPDVLPESIEDPDETLLMNGSVDREELRETVRKILEDRGVDDPEGAIKNSSWTDDKVASAFVEESINYPVIERLREWIEDSGTTERRENRTLNAIEELYRGEEQ